MPPQRISITEGEVERLLAAKGQYLVRDAKLAGFFVVVGTRRKTYAVRREAWQNGRRKAVFSAIGPTDEITAKDARLEAQERLTRIGRGLPPVDLPEIIEPKRPAPVAAAVPAGVTLASAWERYREAHLVRKGRSARTILSYEDHIHRLLKDWKDQPLAKLGDEPALVDGRHDAMTKANGPYIANSAMRTLRAVYNHARKTHRYLPADNPVDAIDWNEEVRRDTGMGLKALPAWFDQLHALENPLRREFHLFSLLPVAARGALKVAEVEHLDFGRRMLHIPSPKGGAKKAFDIPLSRPMMRCLIRAIRLGRQMHPLTSERWIFAADSIEGHLMEHKEDRGDLSKLGNDLRQTFRTVGQAAEVPELDIHILMNHALQGVNAGYITKSALMEDHLRHQQERISGAVLRAVEAGRSRRRAHVLAWLRSSRAEMLTTDVIEELAASAQDSAIASVASPDGEDGDGAEAYLDAGRRPKGHATAIKVTTWAGEVFGSAKLERDHGISRSTLHGWQKQNRVIGLLTGMRKHVFPVAQFVDGRPIDGLADIVAATGSPRAAWRWLIEPHPSLDGQAPLDQLQAGEVLAVTSLVKGDFDGIPQAGHLIPTERAA